MGFFGPKMSVNTSKEGIQEPSFIDYLKNIDINCFHNLDKQYDVDYESLYEDYKILGSQSDLDFSINEGILVPFKNVNYSKPFENVFETLKRVYSLEGWQIETAALFDVTNVKKSKHTPTETATIISGKYETNLEAMSTLLAECGYVFFHHFTKIDKEGRKWIVVIYNPKEPDLVNEYIKENIDIVYHASPIVYHESIIKEGFKVKSRNDDNIYYEDRVYFKMGKQGWSGYIAMLKKVAERNEDVNPTRNFNIYKIDGDRFIKKGIFKRDPNCMESCYSEKDVLFEGFVLHETITL